MVDLMVDLVVDLMVDLVVAWIAGLLFLLQNEYFPFSNGCPLYLCFGKMDLLDGINL